MGSASDKLSGIANETAGNVKQGVGKLIGSKKLQAEGMIQEAKGDAQKAAGAAKAGVKKAANKVAESANKKL
jgi:uncharacterized protein YjbJ (UPF0337 family)